MFNKFYFFIGSEKFELGEARVGAKKSQTSAARVVPSHCNLQVAKTLSSEDYQAERDHIHQI